MLCGAPDVGQSVSPKRYVAHAMGYDDAPLYLHPLLMPLGLMTKKNTKQISVPKKSFTICSFANPHVGRHDGGSAMPSYIPSCSVSDAAVSNGVMRRTAPHSSRPMCRHPPRLVPRVAPSE